MRRSARNCWPRNETTVITNCTLTITKRTSAQVRVVVRGGVEPPTFRFSGVAYAQLTPHHASAAGCRRSLLLAVGCCCCCHRCCQPSPGAWHVRGTHDPVLRRSSRGRCCHDIEQTRAVADTDHQGQRGLIHHVQHPLSEIRRASEPQAGHPAVRVRSPPASSSVYREFRRPSGVIRVICCCRARRLRCAVAGEGQCRRSRTTACGSSTTW